MAVDTTWAFNWTVQTALLLTVICFAAFAVDTLIKIFGKSKAAAAIPTKTKPEGAQAEGLAPSDLSTIAKAAADLVDAFNKAGPGTAALVASILFLSVAAYLTSARAPTPPSEKPATDVKR